MIPDPSIPARAPIPSVIARLDAHHRVFIAILAAGICGLLLPWHWQWVTRVIGTWDVFVYTLLILAWATILGTEPCDVVRTAKLQDSGRTAVFVFVIVAACASVFAVVAELCSAKGLDRAHLGLHVLFSILTVLSSWLLLHTIFTLRYAHIYYGKGDEGEPHGGINFPEEQEPDYLDFAYFSFVIGMTSQVSDVSISSRRLRRLALVHGLISFAFNLAILGLTINVLSGTLS